MLYFACINNNLKLTVMIYEISPSVEPLIDIWFYIHANTREEAIIKVKKYFDAGDDAFCDDYDVTRFADCLSCLESDMSENEIFDQIESYKSQQGEIAYVDLNEKMHSTDDNFFKNAWGCTV